jgi:hypothetical protein
LESKTGFREFDVGRAASCLSHDHLDALSSTFTLYNKMLSKVDSVIVTPVARKDARKREYHGKNLDREMAAKKESRSVSIGQREKNSGGLYACNTHQHWLLSILNNRELIRLLTSVFIVNHYARSDRREIYC